MTTLFTSWVQDTYANLHEEKKTLHPISKPDISTFKLYFKPADVGPKTISDTWSKHQLSLRIAQLSTPYATELIFIIEWNIAVNLLLHVITVICRPYK